MSQTESSSIGHGSTTVLGLLWLAITVTLTYLASIPTSTEVQGTLGIAAVVSVALLKPFGASSMYARVLVLSFAGTIVFRYWFWRLSSTLPDFSDPISYAAALALFLVESYAVAIFFLTAFINADPIDRPAPERVKFTQLPTVDVLIPSYNEPAEMLKVTLAAAKNIVYPKDRLRVVLCDDGGTDQRCGHADPAIAEGAQKRRAELQAMCDELGVTYMTRERNESAKAGNLSAALARLNGDLVAVFDADHVPTEDFLARTVGYFVKNPRLFLVQTPHFFLNADPIERNVGLPPHSPPENEMFYSQIHRGLDRWGGAFFCGSAALLRRAAIDEAGGFSGQTITEDAETALDIHSRGWQSMYVNHPMIAGLQPETFATFIQQRGRWATGMIQMLLLKNPLFRTGLSIPQRLCYLNSISFWLFPIVRMGFLIAPLFYLFFGLEIFVATSQEIVAYMVSYLLVSIMVQNMLFARSRWPLVSEIYEVAQTPYLLQQIIKTVLKPRAATFSVTAKDEVLDDDYVSPIARPLIFIAALMAAGVVAAMVRWYLFPGDRTVVLLVGLWAVFNFLLVAVALRAVLERRQRRRVPRIEVNTRASVFLADERESAVTFAATVRDASMFGARVVVSRPNSTYSKIDDLARLQPGLTVRLSPEFPDTDHSRSEILCKIQKVERTVEGLSLGLEFVADQSSLSKQVIAYLAFRSSQNWQTRRRNRSRFRGLSHGMLSLAWLGLSSFPGTVFSILKLSTRRKSSAAVAAPKDAPIHLFAFEDEDDENHWPEPPGHPSRPLMEQGNLGAWD